MMFGLPREARVNVVDLFNNLLVADPEYGDSSQIADLASAIIPKILTSENYENLQALKARAERLVAESGSSLSVALKKSIEEIFIACVDRLSILSQKLKAVTSSAYLVPAQPPSPQFHPRKGSGSEEEIASEPLSHWLEVTVPI